MAPDPYRYFRQEARELLDQFGAGVTALEKGEADDETVRRLLRLAHTLKGAARVVRQPEIAERAHAIEAVLGPARDDRDTLVREHIDAVLEHLGHIASRVTALSPAAVSGPAALAPAADSTRSVRAEIAEIDGLLDRVGTAQSGLVQLRTAVDPRDHRAAAAVDRLDRDLRQVRAAVEQLRLAPAQGLFGPLERTARDAARAAGKEVSFSGNGGAVRLDADVLGTVQPALVQLVRNAVAHGIEPAAARRAAGKPDAGRVVVTVARSGGRAVFTCRDDGAGIDEAAVQRLAARHGIDVTALEAPGLGALLMRGGLSTAASVTELSGRGIGLDIVRTTAERLGGTVAVETSPGSGACFTLSVPLSLVAVDALGVEAGGVRALLPLDAVRGAVRVAAVEITRTAGRLSLSHGGETIAFVPLAQLLGMQSATPSLWSCILVAGAGGAAALGVDTMRGVTTAVMRPLPELTPPSALVGGTTLDEEGVPLLVLNPDGVVTAVRRAESAPIDAEPTRRHVLVIDDSLTTRMLERNILETAGYEVDLAASAEEALSAARRKRYAAFLVDIEMPGMDGVDFIARTRADQALRDVPAVLVSSRAAPEDVARGRAAGARGHIDKASFDQAALLALLEPLIAEATQ